MFTNFIKVTLRTLYREKVYATLNIVGLSIAIACCIILGLYIRSELTYDRHNLKHKQIYRIIRQWKSTFANARLINDGTVSPLIGPLIKKEFPEVKEFVRFARAGEKHLFRYEDISLYWDNTYYVDNSVFDVFTHKILYGDPGSALIDRTSIAISESFAKKYFKDENPVGKLIRDDVTTYKITLVFADLPENTHLRYDVLISHAADELNKATLSSRDLEILHGSSDYTYLLMPEDYNAADFEKISEAVYKNHVKEDSKSFMSTWRCWLQPLSDAHFDMSIRQFMPVVNYYYLYGFSAVAIFILLVACINYINLAIARAAKRAKEVGMRKILGSDRKNLIIQFSGESVFFSLVALLLGLALAEACLKLTNLNELIGKSLSLNFVNEPQLFFWVFLLSLVFGLISGIYPAFYLSSIRPASAFSSGYKARGYSIRLREMLVSIQFMISVCIIACTLLMFMQMHYISNKPLGFNEENRLIVTLRGADLIDKVPTIKNELTKNGDIYGASFCTGIIGKSYTRVNSHDAKNNRVVSSSRLYIDKDFISVMGIEIISGSDFNSNKSEDYIVNEAMVKSQGWDQPIGEKYFPVFYPGKVIGVVKDFHIRSLYSAVDPFMFMLYPGTENSYEPYSEISKAEQRRAMTGYLVLKINAENTPQTIKYLEENLDEFDAVHPFEFEFLDDALNEMYFSEQNVMRLIGIFASVCIFISCLGLFGLTAFSTEQRTKEIGTRKVLGATTWQIIAMFSKRILLLVLGGAVFASLAAYYVMDEWLTRFAYKIDIEIWVFFVSVAVVALLAFIAVAVQAGRAAQADPVKALRYE